MENQTYLALQNNKLLENIDISGIDLASINGEFISINEGEILFNRGDDAESIYLVVNGEINLLKKQETGKTLSSVFGENEFFGEEEFLKDVKRNTTAVAITDSYLIRLNRTEVNKLIDQNQEIAVNLSTNVPIDDDSYMENFVDETLVENIFDESVNHVENKQAIETEKIDISEITEPVENNIAASEQFHLAENENLVNDISEKIQDTLPVNHEFPVDPTSNFSNENDTVLQNNLPYGGEMDISNNNQNNLENENFKNEFETGESKNSENISDNQEINTVEKLMNDLGEETHNDLSDDLITNEPDMNPAYLYKNKIINDEDIMTKEQLEMIIKAAQLVNSNIKLDDVLKSIVDVAVDLTNADRGTLYLVDKQKHELWSKVLLGDELKEIRLKFGEGLAGWTAKNDEVINIKDAYNDKRFNESFDKESGYKTETILCYPIKNKREEIIGVLQLLNSANGAFNEKDEWFLNALSSHASIALENASLVEKLLETERNSSLGKMGSFLIQDIKKPVLVSKRYAEHLSQKNLPREIKQVVDMLLEQLNQVSDLILTTSNYTEGSLILRKENKSLNDTLKEFINRVEPFTRTNNCDIITELSGDVNVYIDSKEFYQCFYNIIKNACQALPEGGNIFVGTSRENNYVNITFEDKGTGIEAQNLEKVFEPFTSFGNSKGPGLGLAITKKIVEDHNGKISIESKPNEGTTVNIQLPVR